MIDAFLNYQICFKPLSAHKGALKAHAHSGPHAV